MESDVNYYHYGNPTPREVELKFQMPYPCWLKLEGSQLFQTFLEGLEVLQKGGEQELTLQDVKKKIPAIQRQLNGGQKKIVVIDGPSGPTGKTTAARILADAGIPVYEEYQVIRITMDEPLF